MRSLNTGLVRFCSVFFCSVVVWSGLVGRGGVGWGVGDTTQNQNVGTLSLLVRSNASFDDKNILMVMNYRGKKYSVDHIVGKRFLTGSIFLSQNFSHTKLH